uniref:Plasma membrane ATPase n=1 Tax=Spongospora subterranea TaxID=70186 RepID=A0A0H5QP08_9EUKA|eukprot:CRZ03763.1 hypothetical protein [Spongospora subterranea]
MADDQGRGDDVVIYKLNHKSSKFDLMEEPISEPAVPEAMTRTEVEDEHAVLNRVKTLELHEIHETFHSARNEKHRLSSPSIFAEQIKYSSGISSLEAKRLLEEYGRNELKENVKPKWKLFLEQFTAPMPLGIWLAIIIEACLESWLDAGVLLCLQMINGIVGFTEANKAGNAVAALKATLKPAAQVKRDSQWQTIDAALLVPGDCVTLSSGSAVPADCIVNEGTISVDQSALTGESLPVRITKGMQAQMGSTVARGEVEATVVATGMSTFYGKTAALLQIGGDELGELQKLLLRVVVTLLALSVLLCGTTLAYLLLEGEPFQSSVGFVVVLMVASIPIAMEVVVTATLALGSRELASHQAIVAHLSAIERLSGMDVLCSDKTGTLTLNKMMIQQECPVFSANTTRDNVLFSAALATKWNEPAKDALDTMILGAANIEDCKKYQQINYIPFDASIKRTESTVIDPEGNTFRVTKGAPHELLELCHNKASIEKAVEMGVIDLASRGVRSLAVAKTVAGDKWEMLGLLAFLDPPRPDSKATIKKAKEFGVVVKMITGDHQLVAVETAKAMELGNAQIVQCINGVLPTIDLQGEKLKVPLTLGDDYAEFIMSKDGFSQALPEHKYIIVEALKQHGYICGMTGDGVNDAPALKVASVGIAVQGATDAARAAAHIVLTAPGLNAVIEAIIISRRIFVRMHSFLVYRVAATFQLLVFFFVAVLAIHPHGYNASFPKFWSMPVIALIVITVLNDGTIVSIAYDNVTAPKTPQSWDMRKLWTLSTALGSVACLSSLLLLHLALDSNVPNSVYSWFGLSALSYDQVITSIYLKVSLSDFLTIFAARTGTHPCFSTSPSRVLFGAALFAVSCSTILSLFWPFDQGEALTWDSALFVWIYCLIWFVIQDAFKFFLFKITGDGRCSRKVEPQAKALQNIVVQPVQ